MAAVLKNVLLNVEAHASPLLELISDVILCCIDSHLFNLLGCGEAMRRCTAGNNRPAYVVVARTTNVLLNF